MNGNDNKHMDGLPEICFCHFLVGVIDNKRGDEQEVKSVINDFSKIPLSHSVDALKFDKTP